MDTEQALLTKARAGDREALNRLVAMTWEPVYRLIYSKVKDAEEARELTQETFLKALTHLPRFEERGVPFRAFLGRVAVNLVYDLWRKKGRSPAFIELEDGQYPPAPEPVPDEQVIAAEERAQVLAALDTLPEEQRRVIQLRIFRGLSVREASACLGKSEGALKMLQYRALQRLRKLLQVDAREGGAGDA